LEIFLTNLIRYYLEDCNTSWGGETLLQKEHFCSSYRSYQLQKLACVPPFLLYCI